MHPVFPSQQRQASRDGHSTGLTQGDPTTPHRYLPVRQNAQGIGFSDPRKHLPVPESVPLGLQWSRRSIFGNRGTQDTLPRFGSTAEDCLAGARSSESPECSAGWTFSDSHHSTRGGVHYNGNVVCRRVVLGFKPGLTGRPSTILDRVQHHTGRQASTLHTVDCMSSEWPATNFPSAVLWWPTRRCIHLRCADSCCEPHDRRPRGGDGTTVRRTQ